MLNQVTLVNGRPYPPEDLSNVKVIPGVIEAIGLLRELSFEIVVVTNQPDVSRGFTSKKQVEEINSYLGEILDIQHFFTCFHDDKENCECRKPKSGLLLQAAEELQLDLPSSFMVGDRWRDIQAGQDAGCTCFFIDYSYFEKQPEGQFFTVTSLSEASIAIEKILGK